MQNINKKLYPQFNEKLTKEHYLQISSAVDWKLYAHLFSPMRIKCKMADL
jgi:hypothetical protein